MNVTQLNSDKDEFYISFTQRGDACFASSREGGYGEEDIYYSEYNNGTYQKPVNIGSHVNSQYSEYDPFITADGNGLIFTSSGRKDSFGKGDLYWVTKSENAWGDVNHFGEEINTSSRDFCPYVTSDRKYFFYSSEGDVKYLPIESLPLEFRKLRKN